MRTQETEAMAYAISEVELEFSPKKTHTCFERRKGMRRNGRRRLGLLERNFIKYADS